ncbi:MAG: hypothetical protein M0Q88_02835 [Bacilli bacterium]|nr:hypothetical protein [Bacilli bacterium]
MTKDSSGFLIKKGRSDEQFILTNFNFLDSLNKYSSSDTLGFYIAFKSYINRKDNTKDNQVTYSQKYLQSKFNISTRMYYKHLKLLFNIGLIDIEKTVTISFFINYNIDGIENKLIEKDILYFSTLENIDIPLKNNLENLISLYYPEIPKELVKIMDVKQSNSYVIHDTPPIDRLGVNNGEFVEYRDWDMCMEKFQRGKEKKKDKTPPPLQSEKVPPLQSEKDPPLHSEKVNNINELSKTIIESSNSIINQSSDDNIDGLIEFNEHLESVGFKTYTELIEYIGLSKEYFEYPYTEWIDAVKKAIWEMYYYEDTRIKGIKVKRYDVIDKLQTLDNGVITSAINKIIESSKAQGIEHPIAFIKTVLFNEVDEFLAKIQVDINFDLYGDEVIDNNKKNRFHNFKSRTDNYTEEDLEEVAKKKRSAYKEKHTKQSIV